MEAAYRRLVRQWLQQVQVEHDLPTQEALGKALRKGRTTAGRYLGEKVRPELADLMALAASLNIEVPQAIVAAYYNSQPQGPPPVEVKLEPTSKTVVRLVPMAKLPREERPQAARLLEPKQSTRRVPIISAVAAGRLTDPDTQIPLGDYQTIEISGLPPGDYFATRVDGNSMDRISPPGSLIIVNRAERDLYRGRRYIFSRRGKTTYKRWDTDPMRLVPESTDPTNDPIFPKSGDEWLVIGRVRLTLLDDI